MPALDGGHPTSVRESRVRAVSQRRQVEDRDDERLAGTSESFGGRAFDGVDEHVRAGHTVCDPESYPGGLVSSVLLGRL